MENETINEIYQVKIPQFEGPFNLLLNLIEEKKLFINEISLAKVTEEYLNYLQKLEKFESEKVAGFLVIAATLILIKSKSLLPTLSLTEEEEEDIKNLEDRLRLFELYSELSINIKKNFGKQIIFERGDRKIEEKVFIPDSKITKENIFSLAQKLIMELPKKEEIPKVEVRKVINIEEMIENLTKRIQENLKFTFSNFAGKPQNKEEKVFVIVSFLAVLELARQGVLSLIQENNFEEISIEKIQNLETIN